MIGEGVLANLDIIPTKYLAFISIFLTFFLIFMAIFYVEGVSLFELVGGWSK